MELGASFSHRYLKSLGIDPLVAIEDFKKLGLAWIRLGCYWDEIEPEQGMFVFREIDLLVKFCERNKINIVFTVGMKAPRYPEYYISDWLLSKLHIRRFSVIKPENKLLLGATLNYIAKVIRHFRSSSAIRVWQVENEPLDPSGEKWWRISPKFLKKEVVFVRSLDPKRKILVNLWGNWLTKRIVYKQAMELADVVGFDIYLRHPVFFFFNLFNQYIGPLDSESQIRRVINQIKVGCKDVWITELQAEPWEVGELTTKKENPPSFLPRHLAENINYGKALNPSVILLWGFEWWYYRRQKGDLRYWNEAKKGINQL